MKKRPALKPGDVVRLSHFGRQKSVNRHIRARTFTVVCVRGDPTDGFSKVKCAVVESIRSKNYGHSITLSRRELWYTGYNVSDRAKVAQSNQPARNTPLITPKNTNGCDCGGYVCGVPCASWCSLNKHA